MKLTMDGKRLHGAWQVRYTEAFGGTVTVVHVFAAAADVPKDTVSRLKHASTSERPLPITISGIVPTTPGWPVTAIDADWRWIDYNGWHVLTISQDFRPALFSVARQG